MLLKLGLLAVVVVGSLSLLAIALSDEDGTSQPERVTRVKVQRVYSGGEAKTESDEKLVYAGIRTPSRGDPFFEEAKRRNAALVEGKTVRLRFEEQGADRKEQLCAYVYADRVFVNEILVREGLAYVRRTAETRRYAEVLLAAQQEARRKRRGLWTLPPPDRVDRYPANTKHGNFHRPDCGELPNIKAERLVVFNHRNEAFDEGFAPCGRCRP
ncbi:MAG: thermonuclease family protein [bacterium]|nr:thermonuclease family protein [bacterium]